MIETLAMRMAISLNAYTGNKSVSVDHVRFQLAKYIQIASIWLLSLLIGLITDQFLITVVVLVVFGYFRYVTGGFHLSLDYCVLLTVFIVSLSVNVHFGNLGIFSIITTAIVIAFGYTGWNKVIALFIILLSYTIQNEAIVNCLLLQSLTLIPYKGGGSTC